MYIVDHINRLAFLQSICGILTMYLLHNLYKRHPHHFRSTGWYADIRWLVEPLNGFHHQLHPTERDYKTTIHHLNFPWMHPSKFLSRLRHTVVYRLGWLLLGTEMTRKRTQKLSMQRIEWIIFVQLLEAVNQWHSHLVFLCFGPYIYGTIT